MKIVISHSSWDDQYYQWEGTDDDFRLLKLRVLKIDSEWRNWIIKSYEEYVQSIPKFESLLTEMEKDVS